MAGVGIYLHRRNFVVGDGKRTLALISQQVTIPAFLFSKIIYCNQDWSTDPCPNVTSHLGSVWMLLVWPIYVVAVGFLVGWLAGVVSDTPKWQMKSVLAACAFGNSTGLPITLLAVIHANFPATSKLGSVDPALFLAVYLLMYPVLQWSIGGWLLAPEEEDEEEEPESQLLIKKSDIETVLQNKMLEKGFIQTCNGIEAIGVKESAEQVPLVTEKLKSYTEPAMLREDEERKISIVPLIETVKMVMSRVFQPPVVGAVLGLIIASTRLRGIFVDLIDRADKAALEWIFDGIYSVGQAAVPINMIILGCNLSAAQMKKSSDKLLSMETMIAMVVGKMVVMPIIGISSVLILKKYFWNIPDGIDASFYLVAMIVFITPTANNVMVMVELSGSGTKEGIAQVIGFQYLCAPLLLSLTVTAVVAVAGSI
eukprot:CAMPEP_0172486472 /NCGR_PEP_ID=MMETSP1066-20121228/15045_1 /TAXON_ID=671091 /ORGANISM="Coscinodiscus wailesii, Strain CCMP2513" /LENGTH=424 /DNA_ID=CAMNT_0013252443 /DNA_START=127 /DNA_END=1401 /DNA_ORIENTATION=-